MGHITHGGDKSRRDGLALSKASGSTVSDAVLCKKDIAASSVPEVVGVGESRKLSELLWMRRLGQ